MDRLRKIAWAVLLGTVAVLGTCGPPAERAMAGDEVRRCWPWPVQEEEDDPFGLEDEFEGEGWGFWGV